MLNLMHNRQSKCNPDSLSDNFNRAKNVGKHLLSRDNPPDLRYGTSQLKH